MIVIPLPFFELAGGTCLLVQPSGTGAVITDEGIDLTILPVNDHVELRIASKRHNFSIEWTQDEALTVINAILSKLYYLRGVR